MRTISFALALLLLPSSAFADEILTYTGGGFTSVSGGIDANGIDDQFALGDQLTETIDLATPLGDNDNFSGSTYGGGIVSVSGFFNWTPDVSMVNPENLFSLALTTDAEGNITSWSMNGCLCDSVWEMTPGYLLPSFSSSSSGGDQATLDYNDLILPVTFLFNGNLALNILSTSGSGPAGQWTVVNTAPEPRSSWLILIAITFTFLWQTYRARRWQR